MVASGVRAFGELAQSNLKFHFYFYLVSVIVMMLHTVNIWQLKIITVAAETDDPDSMYIESVGSQNFMLSTKMLLKSQANNDKKFWSTI